MNALLGAVVPLLTLSEEHSFSFLATGFFLEISKEVFLVTCKHIVEYIGDDDSDDGISAPFLEIGELFFPVRLKGEKPEDEVDIR